ncbi:MAG: hypothetical protein FWE61_04600 [Micrococcales bacterium]|nr:hypothetical protein [Micrococcales bacterium]
MGEVLGVHGISQARSTSEELSATWTRALADGWSAGRQAPAIVVPHLSPLLVASTGRLGGDGQWTDEEIEFVRAAAMEYLGDPDDDELAELEEAGRTLGMLAVPTPLLQVVRALDATLTQAWRERILALVREVATYLTHAQVREQVRDALAAADPAPGLVVGHSLGSVIVYDLAVHGAGYDTVMTMGSPLGLKTIRNHAALVTDAGPPPARWTNIHDPNDLVTFGVGLRRSWSHVDDVEVRNARTDAHGAGPYLSRPQTGAAVARLLAHASGEPDPDPDPVGQDTLDRSCCLCRITRRLRRPRQ